MNKTLVGLTAFLLFSLQVSAQVANVNLPGMDEAFRRAQLMGNGDLSTSGSVRPYDYSLYDSAFNNSPFLMDQSFLPGYTKTFSGTAGKFALLPLMLNQQYNSANPFGWNDGSMIAARGYQVQASAGLFFQYGPLHIQINPEVVWAQNQNFTTLQDKIINTTARNIYNKYYASRIDNPEKMGNGNYHQFLPGQSSVTLNVKSIAVGISTENLWWGPGVNNSLIMSNNAAGFAHLSLNTTRPLRTPVGSFEWQLISGITETSKVDTLKRGKGYLNGLILTYHPKWIKGLFIGLVRAYNQFYDNAVKKNDYLPVVQNLFPVNDKTPDFLLNRDQVASVFFRYVLQKAKAEIYAEYGRNDASYDLRDLLMSPEHSRAFIIGGQKLFPLTKKNQFIQIQSEITQLQEPGGDNIRPVEPWYVHSQVTRGYTNQGKVLGAGIGAGSNCANIAVKWIRENSIIGINLEQIDRNNDLYYLLFTNPAINRKWVDNVIGFTYSGAVQKDLYINAEADYIRSQNYHWLLDQYSPADPANNITEYKGNLHLKVSLIYKL